MSLSLFPFIGIQPAGLDIERLSCKNEDLL